MKRKKKKNTELIIGSSLSVVIMLLIYTSFSWSSYTKLSQLKDIRNNIKITGASIVSDEEFYSQLEILNGVELEEINLREVSLLLESNPYVKAVRVSRQYPSTLSIEILERFIKSLFSLSRFLDYSLVI